MGPGEWFGALVNKPVKLLGGPGTIIVDGPKYGGEWIPHIGFILATGADGSTICSFTFKGGYIRDTGNVFSLAIHSRWVDKVTFTGNTIINCGQCISNNGGDNWVITHNTIKGSFLNSDGQRNLVGIFLVPAQYPNIGNLIAFNSIEAESEQPLIGIKLMTSSLYESRNNVVVANKIRLLGPLTKGIWVKPPNDGLPGVFYENVIALNDLRGCATPLDISPELLEVNTVWKNLI